MKETIINKAIEKFYAYMDAMPTDMFEDDEHKSKIAEACETLIRQQVKLANVENVVAFMNYPEEAATVYSQFVESQSAPKENFRNALAKLLSTTAEPSDNFTVVFK
jgi:hypothetical protein